MAFEDLREQLKDRANEALAKIQETSAFNSMRERYESQTPSVQKIINIAAVVFTILFVFWFPYSYISTSSETLAQFEENRDLIAGLLRASRTAKEPAPLPPPMSSDTLRSSIDGAIRPSGLLGEQIGEMTQIPDGELKNLAPAGVIVTGIAVKLKKLNVAQVLELSNVMQNMAPGIKLLGVDVEQSAGTTHYYDLVAQVVNFGLPVFDTGAPEDTGSKKPGGKNKKKDSDLEAE